MEVCWDGLWTLSFGLSQSHGHGPWLVCEVALSIVMLIRWLFIQIKYGKFVSIKKKGLAVLKVSANIGASTLPCLATSTNWLGPHAWVMEISFETSVVTEISFETSMRWRPRLVMEISFGTSGGDL